MTELDSLNIDIRRLQLYEKRELKLLQWQDHLLKDFDTDLTCVTGGYGSGKTFAAALWAYERIKLNFPCDLLWIEPTNKLIDEVAKPAFEDLFNSLGLIENVHFKWTISKGNVSIKFFYPNSKKTNRIIFLSAEEPQRIVGYTRVGAFVIDEYALTAEVVLKNCRMRARSKMAQVIQGLMVTTPEGLNFCADQFDSEAQPDWYHLDLEHKISVKFVKNQDPESKKPYLTYKRIRATTYENKENLSPDYIAQIYDTFGHNQNYIDSYLFGLFRQFATGMAYSNYKAQLHKIKKVEPSQYLDINLCFDFNICPQWVVLQDYHPKGTDLKVKCRVALEEANLGQESLLGAIAEFCQKFPLYKFENTRIVILGDPTGYHRSHKYETPGLSDFEYIRLKLKEYGFKNVVIRAVESMPLERTSVDLVNNEFFGNRLYICENCTMIEKSLLRTAWKKGAKANLHKPTNDTWTHPMDAVKCGLVALKQTGNIIKAGR